MDINSARQYFAALIASAVILFLVETFIPGGILGVIGVIALIAAVIIGYQAFPPFGTLIAVGIFITTVALFVLWLKILPKTWIAKMLTISKDLSDAHATNDSLEDLLNKEGVTTCPLHPSGFATIDGKKVDVISQGDMIDKGETVKVVDIESNRVVVRKI
jgi:membrane-bound serine protease (ClpP class)